MTYRELIHLYKDGKLDKEQEEKVKKDIERQEAISEYLFEEDEIPELDILENESEEDGYEENDTTKMIKAAIRKAFIKMGVVVGSVVLVVVLFVIFALPRVVDLFYYDPGEIVGSSNGMETNRMSLDFAIYSELFLPVGYRQEVRVEENGYGKYDIDVIQQTSYTDYFTNVAGKIERNKMTLYNSGMLDRPAFNAFLSEIPGVEDYYEGPGAAGDIEEAKKALQNLNESDLYVAYVTLSEVMDYNSFVEWDEKKEAIASPMWCAIAQKTEEGYVNSTGVGMIGFIYSGGWGSIDHEEDYPYLTQWDVCLTTGEEQDWIVSEDVMTTHVVSMLRYMEEQKDFNRMMESEEDYAYIANNVEEHGLNIYGFVMIGQKEDLLKLSQDDKVAYINTDHVR